MKIEITDNKAMIYTPYNPTFVGRIKQIGGAKWDSAEKCWTIPADCTDDARAIMREVYGEDDLPAKRVTVTVTVERNLDQWRGPVELLGKVVASAFGRDSGAKVGDDATFVKGSPKSSGSMKNWHTTVPAGCVFRLRNVPEAKIKEAEASDDYTFVIEDETAIDIPALQAEKERLLARIAEIDKLIASAS